MPALHPFLVRLSAAFALCVVVMAVVVVAFLWRSNEPVLFGPAADDPGDVLWGPAFNQMEFVYKLRRARNAKPDVLVLGSSTANQFRAEMFPGTTFYNAAGGGRSFTNARKFLEQLFRDHRPKLVIVIPAWVWLNPRRDVYSGAGVQTEFSYRAMVANALVKLTDPKFLIDIATHDLRIDRDPVGGRRPIGYMAARFGAGYRPDGSYQYGRFLDRSDLYYDALGFGYANDFRYFRTYVQEGKGRFQFHGMPGQHELDEIRDLVQTAKKAGTELIFVLTPIARPVLQDIFRSPDWARFFQRFFEIIEDAGNTYGFETYNFTRMDSLGVSDAQTIDALHSDETTYLAMVYRIAHAGRTLASHIDVAALDKLYKTMQDPKKRPHEHLIAR